jgi:sulfide dehydrogenase cytochrome subunit
LYADLSATGEKAMNLKYVPMATLLVAFHLCVGAADADTDVRGQRLAASCAACHGTHGVSAGGVLPVLAGMPKDVLIARLKEFKLGTRPSTVMQQLSKGYSDEQIELIAAYFAALKPVLTQ